MNTDLNVKSEHLFHYNTVESLYQIELIGLLMFLKLIRIDIVHQIMASMLLLEVI